MTEIGAIFRQIYKTDSHFTKNIDTIAAALRENFWNPERFFAKLSKPNF